MSSVKSNVLEVSNFDLLIQHCEAVQHNAWVLVDVDNTIITPQSAIFRRRSKYRAFIDEIKQGKHTGLDVPEIISKWRLQRKVMLIDERWPALISTIRGRDAQVFAFTHMGTGRYGSLHSMEKWRYDELKSLGIEFSQEFLGISEMELLPRTQSVHASPAVFYKGLFLTGSYDKMQMLPTILEKTQPSEIIFVDDLVENVEGLKNICQAFDVPYTGILFTCVDNLEGETNDEIVALQKAHLIQHGIWLEDDAAAAIMKKIT